MRTNTKMLISRTLPLDIFFFLRRHSFFFFFFWASSLTPLSPFINLIISFTERFVMRLAVHHRKNVVGGSTLLAMLVNTNWYMTFFVSYPVMLALFAQKFESLDYVSSCWYTSIITAWVLFEIPRLYLGLRGNRNRSVASLLGFTALTLTLDLALMIVFNIIIPLKNSMDYAVTVCQLFFAASETVLVIQAMIRIVRENTVDFYVKLGAFDSL
jgi:hypothetical protein